MRISTGHNTGLAKVAVQCSADTFVVNESLVLRIKFCGKNRAILVAAKRYMKPDDWNSKINFRCIFKRV